MKLLDPLKLVAEVVCLASNAWRDNKHLMGTGEYCPGFFLGYLTIRGLQWKVYLTLNKPPLWDTSKSSTGWSLYMEETTISNQTMLPREIFLSNTREVARYLVSFILDLERVLGKEDVELSTAGEPFLPKEGVSVLQLVNLLKQEMVNQRCSLVT